MDQPVQITDLADKLKAAAAMGVDERIYVRGANQVNYGRIAEVMSIITAAGYKKVALVTNPNKN
jgi:biopolymer transport protein TolR